MAKERQLRHRSSTLAEGGMGALRQSWRVLDLKSAGRRVGRSEAENRGNELTVGLQVSRPVGDMGLTYVPTGTPSLRKTNHGGNQERGQRWVQAMAGLTPRVSGQEFSRWVLGATLTPCISSSPVLEQAVLALDREKGKESMQEANRASWFVTEHPCFFVYPEFTT